MSKKMKSRIAALTPFSVISLSILIGLILFVGSAGIEASTPETSQSDQPEAQVIGQLNGATQYTYFPISRHDSSRAMNVFGVETYLTPQDGLEKLIGTGTYWVHGIWAHWADIEPTEGARNWAAMANDEEKMKIAALNELTGIVTVRYTPSWAQRYPGVSCGQILSDKIDEFATFMGDLVTRYSQAPYNIDYWEIWNEPDIPPHLVSPTSPWGCWGVDGDTFGYGGDYYADMLKQVYPAIKTADPNAQVIVGGLLMDCNPNLYTGCEPSWFLRGILDNGGGPYFDGIAFHSYDYYFNSLGAYGNNNWLSAWNSTGPVIASKADFLRTLLSSYSVTDKFLMNLESAILCDIAWGYTCESTFETTKAYYLAQAFAMTIGEDIVANSWYGLGITFVGPVNSRNSALLETPQDPEPAYYTYTFASGILTGASSDRDLTEFTNVMGYVFDRGGTPVWVLWSKNGSLQSITLPGTPSTAYQIGTDGKPVNLALSTALDVTLAPIFLEW